MIDDMDGEAESSAPIWAAFGDLMSVLLGAFVLILVGVIAVQLQLSSRLDEEVKQRQAEAQRRQTLEQALAVPLAAGRVTLVDGRIGPFAPDRSLPVSVGGASDAGPHHFCSDRLDVATVDRAPARSLQK